MSPDIAAVVNLHREGTNAIPTLVSAWRAVQAAKAKGIGTTLVLLLDQPDDSTTRLAVDWKSQRGATVVSVDLGDLGGARNAAAEACSATWLAFLDGDDLWGEQWLWRAYEAAIADEPVDADRLIVWHPAINVIFGDHHSLLHHVDSEDPSFSWSRFRLHNQWTALSFVRRDNVLDLPYPRNDLDAGFGYEDWSWNEEVLRRGGRHRVVPESCHFIHRWDQPSLLARSQQALRTRYPIREGVSHRRRPTQRKPGTDQRVSSATHVVSEHQLSEPLLEQIRLASTIETSVLETLNASGHPLSLPQNFQTHRTPSHVALDQIEAAIFSMPPDASIGAILASVAELSELGKAERRRVVAEVLLDPELAERARGSSSLFAEAIEHYPQLKPAVKSKA